MNRTTFLIDGFNLYHSIIDIETDFGLRVKWLDIRALCSSFLYWVGNRAELQDIFFFSSFAFHRLDPSVIKRHQDYIKCLQSTGIQDIIGRFKEKTFDCPRYNDAIPHCSNCNGRLLRHEEKETDVAIATKLLELLSRQLCDTVVIMTGDTDLVPAIKTAKLMFPDNPIRFIFPYRRKNKELAQLVPSLNLKPKHYTKHLLVDPFPLSDGTLISKPPLW